MEKTIYDYLLANCKGRENSKKGWQIISEVNFEKGDKSFRKIIQNINSNKDYKYLIGAISGKGENAGYFIAVTLEEKEMVINNKKHRANQILRDCHIMEWKANMEDENNE